MYGTVVNDMHPVLTKQERLQNLTDENVKLRKERDTLCHRIDELCMENEELKARNANQMKLLESCHEELISWHEVARLVQSKIDEFEVTTDGS